MIQATWRKMKTWRRLRIGPIGLFFGFRRVGRVTRGTSRSYVPAKHPMVGNAICEPERTRELAMIIGVGPGFGYALAETLGSAGFDLVLVARDADRLATRCANLRRHGVDADSYGADVTHESDVDDLFAKVLARHGCPALIVYSLQEFCPGTVLDTSVPAFENSWRHNCLGAFLIARAAGRAMSSERRGSIFLIGSTSSILGRAGHLNLAIGKFGQRALSQVLARELWPIGVHVAHVVIDADISESEDTSAEMPQADPRDIAVSILALHNQPRTAWSSEIDLRPCNEAFWEHC